MKKLLLLVVLAVVGVTTWYFFVTRKKPKDETPRLQPVAVSQHSAAFNGSVNAVLDHYHALTEAFVNWDSAAVPGHASALQARLDSVQFGELEKDATIHQTAVSYLDMFRNDLSAISGQNNLTSKRQAYHAFSQNLYDLLRIIKYDNQKLYLQECPMAFNDTEPGLWLSKTDAIRNPYLGLHHPKYKAGMLKCGETKDTINFTSMQSAGRN